MTLTSEAHELARPTLITLYKDSYTNSTYIKNRTLELLLIIHQDRDAVMAPQQTRAGQLDLTNIPLMGHPQVRPIVRRHLVTASGVKIPSPVCPTAVVLATNPGAIYARISCVPNATHTLPETLALVPQTLPMMALDVSVMKGITVRWTQQLTKFVALALLIVVYAPILSLTTQYAQNA